MNSGMIYKLMIDPLLNGIHSRTASLVPTGSNVIDIACGEGTLAIKMSKNAKHVTGIDLSSRMINYASKRIAREGIENLNFIEMDASDLSDFKDGEFDVATISLAVHQFKLETAFTIIKEMQRIARMIILMDYNNPLPEGFKGFAVRAAERMAGGEHNRNFKSYIGFGGILPILNACDINIEKQYGAETSIFTIVSAKGA